MRIWPGAARHAHMRWPPHPPQAAFFARRCDGRSGRTPCASKPKKQRPHDNVAVGTSTKSAKRHTARARVTAQFGAVPFYDWLTKPGTDDADFPDLIGMGALPFVLNEYEASMRWIRDVNGPALRLITPQTAVDHPPLLEFELVAAAHTERYSPGMPK